MEFTRQGNLDKAIEVRDLQAKLSAELDVPLVENPPPGAPPSSPHHQNPNAYPFLLEPELFNTRAGVTQRISALEPAPKTEGSVSMENDGIHFSGGHLMLTPRELEPLREAAGRNQMITIELSLTSRLYAQGSSSRPAGVFQWGSPLANANLALTQEGNDLYLHITTGNAANNKTTHRVDLGSLSSNSPTHLTIVYRSNACIIYRNGVATSRLRDSLKGGLSGWNSAPMILGGSMGSDNRAGSTHWNGRIHQLCIKAGQDGGSKVMNHYNRFRKAMDL